MSIEWPAHGLKLQARIESVQAVIAIDYVGLPLQSAFAEAHCPALVESAKLVIDTRNACGKAGIAAENIVRA